MKNVMLKVKFLIHKEKKGKFLYAVFVGIYGHGNQEAIYSLTGKSQGATISYIKQSIPATPAEYAELEKEMTRIGYEFKTLN